jgi:hypothetical protein
VPERTIFRQTAVEAYRRGTEKDVIPRLVSRPITVCRWLLLALLVAATALAWWVTVPTYVGASGVIVGPGGAEPFGARTAALVLLPPDGARQVGVGRPVRLERRAPGTDGQAVDARGVDAHGVDAHRVDAHGVVAAVEPGVVTSDTARQRHPALAPGLVTRPSVVVVVRLAAPPPSGLAPGSRVTAQVQIAERRLITLLPGLRSWSGG